MTGYKPEYHGKHALIEICSGPTCSLADIVHGPTGGLGIGSRKKIEEESLALSPQLYLFLAGLYDMQLVIMPFCYKQRSIWLS
jgi:hypothetical protein